MTSTNPLQRPGAVPNFPSSMPAPAGSTTGAPPFNKTDIAKAIGAMLQQGQELGISLVEKFKTPKVRNEATTPQAQRQLVEAHFAEQNWRPVELDLQGGTPQTEAEWHALMAQHNIDSLAIVVMEDGVPRTTVLTRAGADQPQLLGWSNLPSLEGKNWVESNGRVNPWLLDALQSRLLLAHHRMEKAIIVAPANDVEDEEPDEEETLPPPAPAASPTAPRPGSGHDAARGRA